MNKFEKVVKATNDVAGAINNLAAGVHTASVAMKNFADAYYTAVKAERVRRPYSK